MTTRFSVTKQVTLIVITLQDSTNCVLPAWMIDEQFCVILQEKKQLCISISALLNLWELLDKQSLSCGNNSISPKIEDISDDRLFKRPVSTTNALRNTNIIRPTKANVI